MVGRRKRSIFLTSAFSIVCTEVVLSTRAASSVKSAAFLPCVVWCPSGIFAKRGETIKTVYLWGRKREAFGSFLIAHY